jgi:acyl carrier protein
MARVTQREFEASLLAFVTRLAARPAPRTVRAHTPLFTRGLLDSLRILDLISFVESALGIRIPDRRVTLENFKSVSAISDAFWKDRSRGRWR